uniref:Ig-like domain-containing protein n=1 Tax=Macrostomum lignano TaxID=282301 RepID=A0A1I8J7I1_9PLAT
PVRSASIRLAAPQIRANSPAQILLLASDRGNPPALHSCSASGRILNLLKPSTCLNASSLWTWNFPTDDSGQKVYCEIVQTAKDGSTLFNQTFSSGRVELFLLANNSLTFSPSAFITEGDNLTITAVSVGGRPPVRNVTCWAGGTLLQETAPSNASLAPDRFEKQFMLNAITRKYNRRTLSCAFEQDDKLAQWINTTLDVFYAIRNASISLSSARILSESAVSFTLQTSDSENPPARHFCHLAERTLQQ